MSDRFDDIFNAVSHGALDCENKQIEQDMFWLCEEVRDLREELRKRDGGLHERLRRERNEATLRLGKGRWCPACKSWLQGLQSSGEACGTCHGKIEWRDLAELRRERDEALTYQKIAETAAELLLENMAAPGFFNKREEE